MSTFVPRGNRNLKPFPGWRGVDADDDTLPWTGPPRDVADELGEAKPSGESKHPSGEIIDL